jgi:hypothetical protein
MYFRRFISAHKDGGSTETNPAKQFIALQSVSQTKPGPSAGSSYHKLPSDFYLYRSFKMVANLSYDYEVILTYGTSILVSLVDYNDPDALVSTDVPNLVDGSFQQTAAKGFGPYGDDMYLAVPSQPIPKSQSQQHMVQHLAQV